jgi:hypothetical protein
MNRILIGIGLVLASVAAHAESCIASGDATKYTYFVAVDSADFTTREAGLSGFAVYRSRNGAAEVAYTTPTITEIDATNMPGVYALLLDEDTTLDSTDAKQDMALHITVAGMAPVTKEICIERLNDGVFLRGTAQAGATATITLPATASATNDFYRGATIQIVGGTGVGQSRIALDDYDGTAKTVTVNMDWTTTPDSTSQIVVYATAPGAAGLDAPGFRAAFGMASASYDTDQATLLAATGVLEALVEALPTNAGLAAALGIVTGTCDSGSATTCVDSALIQTDASLVEDQLVRFEDGFTALVTTFAPGSDTMTTTKVAPSTRALLDYVIFPGTAE